MTNKDYIEQLKLKCSELEHANAELQTKLDVLSGTNSINIALASYRAQITRLVVERVCRCSPTLTGKSIDAPYSVAYNTALSDWHSAIKREFSNEFSVTALTA